MQGSRVGTYDVKPRLNTSVVKAIAADSSVEYETLAKDCALKEQFLEKDSGAGNTIKRYEQICTLKEAVNSTLLSKEKYK